MKFMGTFKSAAQAAREFTGDPQATWEAEYEEPIGYSISVRWSYIGQPRGFKLFTSLAMAGSDMDLYRHTLRRAKDLIDEANGS